MEKMEEFTHPVELSDEELELVAAGGNERCGGGEKCEPVLRFDIEAEFSLRL